MDRNKLKIVYTVGFAAVAALIGAVALISALTEPNRASARQAKALLAAEADSYELEALQAQEFSVEPTPLPTPVPPAVPADAAEILCNMKPLFIVPSHAEAETLLQSYLQRCADAAAPERVLSATFACELRIVNALDNVPYYTIDEAMELLLSDLSVIPVTVTSERTTVTDIPVSAETRADATLAKGTRIVTQLGSPIRTVTRTTVTYLFGEEQSVSEPVTETVKQGSPTVVRVGTGDFPAKGSDKQSKKKEQDTSASWIMELTFPLAGKKRVLVTPFGVTDGVFRRGADYEGEAGSVVSAPAGGIVIFCGERGEYGFTVDIDHGNGCISRLTHLSDAGLKLNQRVFSGDTVGYLSADSTGDRAKPVLHYELLVDGIPVDPETRWK